LSAAAVSHVIRAVRFARDHALLVAVRGGGHNIAGSALCDGGLMILDAAVDPCAIPPNRRIAWR